MSHARTPLFALLQRAYALAQQADHSQMPADELLGQYAEHQSRRNFLRATGQMALAAGGFGLLQSCTPGLVAPAEPATPVGAARQGANSPKVVIVGAGIAGLHAAHILTKKGFTNFDIYEAADRTGGRIFTATNLMAPGLTTELGGEFIDSGHKDMLRLAEEFNLPLLDTQAPSEQALIKDAYFFNGRLYSLSEVVTAFREITPQLKTDINSLPDVINYTLTTGPAARFDQLSISAYLNRIGARGLIKNLLEVAYETEYGLSCDEQSAINLLFLISPKTADGQFNIFGASDERYKIAGGNQQLTNRLAHRYEAHIETGRELRAIGRQGSKYALTFSGMNQSVLADYVLLTIPFTKLRQVDINLELPDVKRRAIRQLGYGTNAKLFVGFRSRYWRGQGYSGYYFTDNGAQTGWDNSQLQPGASGGLTVYLGGDRGVRVGTGTPQQQVAEYLPKLNQIFRGASANTNGNVGRFHWPSYRFTLGSYAAYRVGQWTSIGGAEGEPVGNLLFAGEHCSVDFQGYMNGGAETGRRAANQLLKMMLPT